MRKTQLPHLWLFGAVCCAALVLLTPRWGAADGETANSSPASKSQARIAVLAEGGAIAELVADGLRHEAKLPAVVVDAKTAEIAAQKTQAEFVVGASKIWDVEADVEWPLPDGAAAGERAAAIVKEVAARSGHTLSDRGGKAIIRRAGTNSKALAVWAEARASLRSRDLVGAEKQARKAVALDPGAAYAHAELSFALSAKFETKEALKSAQQALESDASAPLALLAKAKALDYANDLAAAAKAYEEVLETSPYEFAALINLGLIRFNYEYDFASATELFERASHANPARVEPLVNLARAYGEVGKNAQAIELLTEAKALEPMNSLVRIYRAEALGRAGKHAAAQQELKELPDTRFAFETALYSGVIALAAGDVEVAKTNADAALALLPTNVHVLGLLGNISERTGDLEVAVKHYRSAIEADARGARKARRDLAIVLSRAGNSDEAAKLLDQSLQFNERDGESLYNRAVVSLGAGQGAEAAAQFEKAFEFAPYLSAAAYNLGSLKAQAGELVGAEEWFRKALKAQPEDELARLALGTILGKSGKWDEAEKLLSLAAKSSDMLLRSQAEESLALVLYGAGKRDQAQPKLEAIAKAPETSVQLRSAIEALLGN